MTGFFSAGSGSGTLTLINQQDLSIAGSPQFESLTLAGGSPSTLSFGTDTFPNDRIILYATSTNYALGIAANTQYYNVPTAAHHEFRYGGTGTTNMGAPVDATSKASGTMVITNGGLGVTGSVWANSFSATSTTDSSSTTTGSIVTAGGAGIAQTLSIGTGLTLNGGSLLANYLVGTWTPAYKSGGSSTGYTYTSQIGNYVRIGNICCITFYLQTSAVPATAGILTMNIPFSTTASGVLVCAGAAWTASVANMQLLIAFNNSAQANINAMTPNGNYINTLGTYQQSTCILSGSGCYSIV